MAMFDFMLQLRVGEPLFCAIAIRYAGFDIFAYYARRG